MAVELHRYAVTPGVGQVFFTPEQLQAVAEAAGASGRVELNTFMQLIVHTAAPDVTAQQARLRAIGLGAYPVGALVKNLHTCTFCMGERIDGLPDAQRLDAIVAGAQVPYTIRIGFSGCANNCGEAILRDVGVVRMSDDLYDLYAGGKAGSLTPLLGLKVGASVTSARLLPAVEAVLGTYRESARGKERLWKHIRRVGPEPYREAIARASQT